ncbi:methionyl-tRNA formyltransferase [Pedobacter sp. KLB.chiD]|uniref:methionyl-tRNA formyltransferase n=1 Tax=Pedobacter sp. KLB.chiD TaxID=3387402 RepID=UPI0039996996
METQKKILVLCGGKFAFPALNILAFEKFICGIGIGKGNKTIVDALEKEAVEHNLGFRSFKDKNSMDGMQVWINSIQPDYIFCISFPFLLPESVLAYGKHRFINFHPGPLPQYRGPMPIFEVLKNMESETAICTHFMNDAFDEGNIIFNDPVPIEEGDTFGKLTIRLSKHTANVALNMANMLQFASIIPNQPQDETLSSYYGNPVLSDTYINWNRMTAEEIMALVNACNPWNVGADATLQGEQVKIIEASIIDEAHDSQLGTIVSFDGRIKIACRDNQQLAVNILSTDYGIMTATQYIMLHPEKKDIPN